MTKAIDTGQSEALVMFLDENKGDNVSLTPDDFKQLLDFFVSKDAYIESQKALTIALKQQTLANEKFSETLTKICGQDDDQESRIVALETTETMTEKRITRKIQWALVVVGLLTLVTPAVLLALKLAE